MYCKIAIIGPIGALSIHDSNKQNLYTAAPKLPVDMVMYVYTERECY